MKKIKITVFIALVYSLSCFGRLTPEMQKELLEEYNALAKLTAASQLTALGLSDDTYFEGLRLRRQIFNSSSAREFAHVKRLHEHSKKTLTLAQQAEIALGDSKQLFIPMPDVVRKVAQQTLQYTAGLLHTGRRMAAANPLDNNLACWGQES